MGYRRTCRTTCRRSTSRSRPRRRSVHERHRPGDPLARRQIRTAWTSSARRSRVLRDRRLVSALEDAFDTAHERATPVPADEIAAEFEFLQDREQTRTRNHVPKHRRPGRRPRSRDRARLFRGPAAQTDLQRTYGGQVSPGRRGRVRRSVEPRPALAARAVPRAGRADSPILPTLPTRDGQHSRRLVTARQGSRRISRWSAPQTPNPAGPPDVAPDVPPTDECPSMADGSYGVVARRRAGSSGVGRLEVRYASGLADSPPHHQARWSGSANGRTNDDPVLTRRSGVPVDLTLLSVSLIRTA